MEDEDPLSLRVQFVDESALWAWEIEDGASKHVVESSWPDQWMGYPTREGACAAGLSRLDQMLGRTDEASLVERIEQCQLHYTPREVLGSEG